MRYYIFQLPVSSNNIFRPLSDDPSFKININDYVPVYTGEISSEDIFSNDELCENLFRRFNYKIPEHFAGHSLSVSDIIALRDDDNVTRFYYCDYIGFKEVEVK